MLTSALAGCVDRDNHPDHHDDEPGLHHHGDEDYHHQHEENNTAEHAESDRHHCHDDQDDECWQTAHDHPIYRASKMKTEPPL